MEHEYREAQKQNRQLHRYAIYCAAFFVLLYCVLLITSCTKPEEARPIVVDTLLPAPTAPTGIIREFSIQDSLVGHGKQTVIKWYVDGTNSLTEVQLNGVKVMFSGAMQSGPLTRNTTFTLTVNNNKQASKMVYVADSVPTLLWNDGIRWRTIGMRTRKDTTMKGSAGQDSAIAIWENTFVADTIKKYEHYRTSFYLNGHSLEEQLSTNFPKPSPSGSYQVLRVINFPNPGIGYGIQWKGTTYLIDSLSLASREMVLYYEKNVNGKLSYNRIRYTPEF